MEQRTVNNFFKITMVSVVIIILISFVFSIYYNIELSGQIEDRNKIIDNLTVQNDLLNQVVPFETDSAGRQYYIFLKSDSNKIYTYDQLYDLVKNQAKIIQKQDAVIFAAKRKYKFNYSVKYTGDSILVVTWDK